MDERPDQPSHASEENVRVGLEKVEARISVSRRRFLSLAAAAAGALLMPMGRTVSAAEEPPDLELEPAPEPLGRIATWWRQAVRVTPSASSEVVTYKSRDDIIPLLGAAAGDPPWPSNPVWYKTEGGYIHSGYVQPVRDEPQPVVRTVPETGFWARVSQPWAEARWSVTSPYVAVKLYYDTVYRVVATVLDEGNGAWYQLQEGYTPWRPSVYVPASSLQIIPPQALAPISVGHPDKRIEIDRAAQMLTCLEGETPVFSTRVATGHAGTATPRGEFRVLYKRHTRRMAVSNIADPYDLPGVAFPVYFTWSGVAIHGTYWHNDYGRVHSHGCVNATADAARWIFRWVDPLISYADYTQKADPAEVGTRVIVF